MTRRVNAALLLSAALAVVAGALGITIALDSRASTEADVQTLIPASTNASALLAAVVDQETGERGYVITANPKFLQPYQTGTKQAPQLIDVLQDNLAGRPTDVMLINAVAQRYQAWRNQFALPQLADVRAHQLGAAIAAERSGRGKTLFDALRTSLAALLHQITDEERSLGAHDSDLQDWLVVLMAATTACALIGALMARRLLRLWVIDPLQALEYQVADVAHGDIDHRVVPAGPSEIQSLGRSVEAMRVHVREQAEAIDHQHEIAVTLQRALLPQLLPTPDDFEIVARFLPGVEGLEIGGDWFNLRIATEHASFFAVGDVSGRGISAASLMALMRFAINAYAAEDPRPASVLRRLSRLSRIGDTGRFATVLCGLFDAESGRLSLASAGHPNPLLITGDEAHIVNVPSGPPIGLGFERYVATSLVVEPGNSLIAYTDGLLERRNEPLSTGYERLAREASQDGALDNLIDDLIATLGAGQQDDVVVLGVKWQSK